MSKCFIDIYQNIKVFFFWVNSNKLFFFSSSFFIAFCLFFFFHSQYFWHLDHFHQFLLQVYSHKNINQFYNLKHYILFICFFPSNELFIFVFTDCSLVKMTSYCLNFNLVLNFCVAVILNTWLL